MELNNENHGIWRILPSQTITEIIAQSGYEFQIFDREHGSYDYASLENDIRVSKCNNCSPWVRVSGLNKVEVQRCLDMGAEAIVFPQLSKYEEFVEATKLIDFMPNGLRGFNPFVRAFDYSGIINPIEKPKCIVIIETLDAVKALNEIVRIKDISMIYIGSYDISAQIGHIGELDHPKVKNVINEIIDKCISESKPVGIMISNSEQFEYFKNKKVSAFLHKIETFQIKNAFINILKQYK